MGEGKAERRFDWRWVIGAAAVLAFLRLLGADVGRVVTGLAWPLLAYWLVRRFEEPLRDWLRAVAERAQHDEVEVKAKAAGVEVSMKLPERAKEVADFEAQVQSTGFKPRLVEESKRLLEEGIDVDDR